MKTKNIILFALLVLLTGLASCKKDPDIPTGQVFNASGGGNSGGGEEPGGGGSTISYTISVRAIPSNGGTVSGGGIYKQGQNCTVTATANTGFTFVNWTESGSQVSTSTNYTFKLESNRVLVAYFSQSHDYVDLGLPSGTLWATCNVGAGSSEEYGYYFAWGETTTKSTYDWSTYKYCNGDSYKLTKYCNKSSYGNNGFTDDLTVLQAIDDAATIKFGSDWHIPTKEQWEELKNNTTVTWTTQNGVNGRKFDAANGNSLFLPAAGYQSGNSINYEGSYGEYWSNSLYSRTPYYSWYLHFNSDICVVNDSGERCHGRLVRAVRTSQNYDYSKIIINEVNGDTKFIEIYNNDDFDIPLKGMYIMKDDYAAGAIWTGDATVVAPAHGYVVLYSVDVQADHPELNENQFFNSGISSKKTIRLTLFMSDGTIRDEFTRGTTGEWGLALSNVAPQSYARTPDGGDWKLAAPTPGAANPATGEDIPQE